MPSTKVPGRVFQHDIPKITLFYMFDDHVIFEGQMSSQRSTRAKSAASFYYCTYLASLEWAILKRFLKYMAQSTPTNLYCSRASFRCAYMHHIEKYVFQQKFCAPGLRLLLYPPKLPTVHIYLYAIKASSRQSQV